MYFANMSIGLATHVLVSSQDGCLLYLPLPDSILIDERNLACSKWNWNGICNVNYRVNVEFSCLVLLLFPFLKHFSFFKTLKHGLIKY